MSRKVTIKDEISGHMTSSGMFLFSSEDWFGMMDQRQEHAGRAVATPWIGFIKSLDKERSTWQSTEVFSSQWETVFTRQTDLGKRLYPLRAKAVAAGMKLLSEEEVLEEVKRRRGETEENEKDLH